MLKTNNLLLTFMRWCRKIVDCQKKDYRWDGAFYIFLH